MKKFIAMLVLASMVFVLSGCGKSVAEKRFEKNIEMAARQSGEDVDVDFSNGTFNVKSDEGEFSFSGGGATPFAPGFGSGEAEVPKDFPKDVPIYKKASVTTAFTMNDEDTNGSAVTLNTKDSVDKVGAFYEKELKKEGWDIEVETQTEYITAVSIEGSKGQLKLNVQIGPGYGTGGTMIMIMVEAM